MDETFLNLLAQAEEMRESEGGWELTNLDLPFHALPVLVATPLFDEVVFLERALEAVLQVRDLQFPRVKVRVALDRALVLVVQFRDAVPNRVGQSRSRVRELGQLRGRLSLQLVVSRRGESARVQVRDVRDVALELLDLVLDTFDLETRGGKFRRDSSRGTSRAGRDAPRQRTG